MHKTDFPLVSIIIVNFNGYSFTKQCVHSILRNTNYPNYEIVIVDSGSTDKSSEKLAREFHREIRSKKIRIIPTKRDIGYSGANNLGFKKSKGELIVFLNNDTIVTKNWLTNLYNAFKMFYHQHVRFVQSKLLLMDDPERIDSVGHIIDPLCFIRAEGYYEVNRGQYDYFREICVVQPAAGLTDRRTIEEIGLFDPEYFILHEDTDFSLRLHLRGYRAILVPDSIVYHKRSPTLKSQNPYIINFHGKKNALITILKNYEIYNALKYFFMRIIVELAVTVWYLYKRAYEYALSTLRAIIYVFKKFSRIWHKRLKVQKMRRVRDKELFKLFDKFDPFSLIKRRCLWLSEGC